MEPLLKAIADGPIPNLLVVAGIVFIFIAIGGQFSAEIISRTVRPAYAALVGAIFLALGLAINYYPKPTPEVTVADPKWNGRSVDNCYHWGVDCGKRAADAFYQLSDYREAVAYDERWNVAEPTVILGGGEVCPRETGQKCSTFSYIRCKR